MLFWWQGKFQVRRIAAFAGAVLCVRVRLRPAFSSAASAMDPSALLHMNEDHSEALEDYCRHFGGAPYAISDAQLTTNTSAKNLEISYCIGSGPKRATCKVPVAREGDDLRSNLVKMAAEASVSRVPAWETPGLLAVGLVAALVVLVVVTFAPGRFEGGLLGPLWMSAREALEICGGRKVGLRLVLFSVVAHVGEGVIVWLKLRRVRKKGGRGGVRIALWVIQTVICGFPSLTLVLGKLQEAEEAKRPKGK